MNKKKREELLNEAIEARKNAYVPYSHFQVGAALLGKNGTIYRGCNIENAAFGSTMCAERTAFFKAVSEGVREFEAIAIVGGPEGGALRTICDPCGNCRQMLIEYCPDIRVIINDNDNHLIKVGIRDLLPFAWKPVIVE